MHSSRCINVLCDNQMSLYYNISAIPIFNSYYIFHGFIHHIFIYHGFKINTHTIYNSYCKPNFLLLIRLDYTIHLFIQLPYTDSFSYFQLYTKHHRKLLFKHHRLHHRLYYRFHQSTFHTPERLSPDITYVIPLPNDYPPNAREKLLLRNRSLYCDVELPKWDDRSKPQYMQSQWNSHQNSKRVISSMFSQQFISKIHI